MSDLGKLVCYVAVLVAIVIVAVEYTRWTYGLTDGVGMLIGLAWAAAAVLIGIVVAVISQPRR